MLCSFQLLQSFQLSLNNRSPHYLQITWGFLCLVGFLLGNIFSKNVPFLVAMYLYVKKARSLGFPNVGATNQNDYGQLLRANSYIVYIVKYTHNSSAQSSKKPDGLLSPKPVRFLYQAKQVWASVMQFATCSHHSN